MLTKPRCGRLLLSSYLLTLLLISTGYAGQRTASATRGDRVTIRPRRLVLVRTGEHAKEFPERSRAIVIYPVVLGFKDLLVLARVRSILQIKNVFGSSLDEYRDDGWLTDFRYKVNYNRNYILDITFNQSGVAAYPDEQTKHFAINLKSGSVIKASDVFVNDKLPQLATVVNDKLKSELKKIVKELSSSRSDPEDVRIATEAQEPLEFKIDNLDDFSVGSKGITFLYDAGYPHVIRAFEPNGRYFFSYAEMKPYIKRDGLLGQFVD